MPQSAVHNWLARRRGYGLTAYASAAAFGAYFSMYAFRKPFTAAEFDVPELWGLEYKILLILAQVAGYTLSKFIGIRVIAELPAARRVATLFGLIALAELALVGFGATPHPYNWPFLFLNGLPLGMVWGVVFAFLEGRRDTDVLGVSLSASFIVSSGVVKGVGRHLTESWGVSEWWMPAATGALFLGPLLLFGWMLAQLPRPSEADESERVARTPMDRVERRRWMRQLALVIALLIGAHMLLTAMRDYRDQFAVEILGVFDANTAGYLAVSELPIMFLILVPLGSVMLVRDNRRALVVLHGFILLGLALSAVSTAAMRCGWLGGYVWYILVGLGLYLAYVPFHSILFDRVVAMRRQSGNAGYLIYLADATGYLSSVIVLLYKNFGAASLTPLKFFQDMAILGGVVGAAVVGASAVYFLRVEPAGAATTVAQSQPSAQ